CDRTVHQVFEYLPHMCSVFHRIIQPPPNIRRASASHTYILTECRQANRWSAVLPLLPSGYSDLVHKSPPKADIASLANHPVSDLIGRDLVLLCVLTAAMCCTIISVTFDACVSGPMWPAPATTFSRL